MSTADAVVGLSAPQKSALLKIRDAGGELVAEDINGKVRKVLVDMGALVLIPEIPAPEGGEKTPAKVKLTPEGTAVLEAALKPVVAEEPVKPLVKVSGLGLEVWKDSGSTFIPVLKSDMTTDERKEVCRKVAAAGAQADDKLKFVGGEALYEINENGYYKTWEFTNPENGETRKYDTFAEYCEFELGYGSRKAYHLIDIYKKFVLELKLPVDQLRKLEWSKAVAVLPIVNADNATSVLKDLGNKTFRQIQEIVKSSKGRKTGDPDVPEGESKFKVNFVLSEEQKENVDQAIALAKTMAGSDKPSHALDLICTDFLTSNPTGGRDGGFLALDKAVASIERAFGVKLECTAVDESKWTSPEESEASA